jgi:hypothetical protein
VQHCWLADPGESEEEMLLTTRKFRRREALLVLALVVGICTSASAHVGPPFPIITDQRVGPCVISLWTHPDIGTGSFWVMVDPPPGGSVPKDVKVQLAIQPIDHRIPEVIYDTQSDNRPGQVQFSNTTVPFDRDEVIKVRVLLQSAAGNGEASAQVEITPTAFGRWDLLFYAFPFIVVAALWYRGIRKRKAKLRRAAKPGNEPAVHSQAPLRTPHAKDDLLIR